jgi:hypothetical protein
MSEGQMKNKRKQAVRRTFFYNPSGHPFPAGFIQPVTVIGTGR